MSNKLIPYHTIPYVSCERVLGYDLRHSYGKYITEEIMYCRYDMFELVNYCNGD